MRTPLTLTRWARSLRFRRTGDVALREESTTDPFATLAVQMRLSRVSAELRRLDGAGRWAAGHHLTAAMMAYDDLLTEAAELSGIELPDGSEAVRRLVLEAQLQAAGWRW